MQDPVNWEDIGKPFVIRQTMETLGTITLSRPSKQCAICLGLEYENANNIRDELWLCQDCLDKLRLMLTHTSD